MRRVAEAAGWGPPPGALTPATLPRKRGRDNAEIAALLRQCDWTGLSFSMLSPAIFAAAVLNGLLTGAVYALIALGLTLIYGVLHIINFAHGALLTAALFAVYFVNR